MTTIYNGEVSAAYAQHRRTHPEVLRQLVAECRAASVGSVVEIGCGTGNYISALREILGCRCRGIDPSEYMLAAAAERLQDIEFSVGSAEAIPLPNGCVDLAFCVNVIHHVEDRPAFYREAYRVLNGGGRLCIVTDSHSMIRQRVPLTRYFPETVEPELRRYPPAGIVRQEMEAVGFADIRESEAEHTYELVSSDAFRDKSYSCLHSISEDAFQRGLTNMERDLRDGPIECKSCYQLIWGHRKGS